MVPKQQVVMIPQPDFGLEPTELKYSLSAVPEKVMESAAVSVA